MWWFAKEDDTDNNDPEAGAQKIDETLQKARDCLFQLYDALHGTEDLTEEVKEILRGHESQISELEQINIEADRFAGADNGIFIMQNVINHNSHRIISQFPGVLDDFDLYLPAPITSHLVELSRDLRKLQFIRPWGTVKSMCSPALTLRNILEGQGDVDAYKELLKNLEGFRFVSSDSGWQGLGDEMSGWKGDGMQQQLCCLQDLRDGGGFGFTVELFFPALSQLLFTSSSKESHSALYTGTFRAISSDWSKHKDSLGTQKLLLDIAMSRRIEFEARYPAYIVDEFLLLLGNIFEGQIGPHIDKAWQHFESSGSYGPRGFRERVLRILTQGQAVTGIVTLPFDIQQSVQPRHLMIHFTATCRIHLIVLRRLRADEVQL
jgi:hypothetical protein